VQHKAAASTQNQARNALVFLYRQVLKKDFGWLKDLDRAEKPARLPGGAPDSADERSWRR